MNPNDYYRLKSAEIHEADVRLVAACMSDNLKPCPFCGGSKIVVEEGLNLTFCNGCSAETDMGDWNTRPIEDELNRRIAKAKDLLNIEMGQWRSVPTGILPDHFIQLRQTLDVLDGGGE